MAQPSKEDVALVEASIEAFNSRDRNAMRRMMAPGAEIVPMRAALEEIAYRGPEALDRFWADTEESWSEVELELLEVEQGTEAVLALVRMRAVGRETGAPVEMDLALVVEIESGRFRRLATHTDIDEARRLAGVER